MGCPFPWRHETPKARGLEDHERRGTQRGKPGKIAQVEFLISTLEEQEEDFRPDFGKEIGEGGHCWLWVNECLPEVNRIRQGSGIWFMVQSIEETHSPTTTISGPSWGATGMGS